MGHGENADHCPPHVFFFSVIMYSILLRTVKVEQFRVLGTLSKKLFENIMAKKGADGIQHFYSFVALFSAISIQIVAIFNL